jgi:toxin CcdB
VAPLVTRQFDVVANPSSKTSGQAPYLVILQSHLMAPLGVRIVAPLLRPDVVESDGTVALSVEFARERFTLAVALLANIEAKQLGKALGSVADHEDAIRRALDRLFTGF